MYRNLLISLLCCALVSGLAFGRESDRTPQSPTDPNFVELVYPNGGEALQEGTDQSIRWKVFGETPLRMQIKLSTDGGKDYAKTLTIIETYDAQGHWLWENVGPVGNQLRIEIIAYYKEYVYEDHSEANFAIVGTRLPKYEAERDCESLPPGDNVSYDHSTADDRDGRSVARDILDPIRVLAPNGGEQYSRGSLVTIKWASRVQVIEYYVFLSTDGGKTFPTHLGKPLPGSATRLDWVANVAASRTCRVKVVAKLMTGSIADESDGNFSVLASPREPNDNEAELDGETGDGIVMEIPVPSSVHLDQNYPNPFNPSTTMAFDLAESGFATLTVFNILGQPVATLVNGQLDVGHHELTFDANSLPSGVYLYQLRAGSVTQVKRMMLSK